MYESAYLAVSADRECVQVIQHCLVVRREGAVSLLEAPHLVGEKKWEIKMVLKFFKYALGMTSLIKFQEIEK